jgi:hypothetical protein
MMGMQQVPVAQGRTLQPQQQQQQYDEVHTFDFLN